MNEVSFRDTGLTPTIGGFLDARIFPLFILNLLIQTMAMFSICIFSLVFLSIVRYFGYPPGIFMAYLRTGIFSPHRSWQTRNTLLDR